MSDRDSCTGESFEALVDDLYGDRDGEDRDNEDTEEEERDA